MNKSRLDKKYFFKKNVKHLLVCYSFFSLFVITSCEQRDPLAEYEILCDSVFSSPSDGEAAAQEYVDYFYDNERAKITEVSEIRHQYRQMDGFLSNSFSSYKDFISQSRDLNYELSQSNYTGVRKTWSSLYGKERDRLLGPLLDSITESVFDDFFKNQVRQLCNEKHLLLTVESIDQVNLSTPTLGSDRTSKKCRGEYRVHLRGSAVGLITSSDYISIEGVIGPDELGNLNYVRTGYQFL